MTIDLADLVDILHILIVPVFWILPLIVLYTGSVQSLILMNCMFLVLFITFSIYKKCILTVFYNRLKHLPACTPFIYVWDRVGVSDEPQCVENTRRWINTNGILASIYLVVDLLFWMRYKG